MSTRLLSVSPALEVAFLACVLIIPVNTVYALPRISVKNVLVREENPKDRQSYLVLPYVLSTESMGLTLGVGAAAKGYGQDQLLLGGTVFGSVDSAAGGFLGMWNYRPSWTERFFFSAQGMLGHYPKQRAYSAVSFIFLLAPQAGRNNESSPSTSGLTILPAGRKTPVLLGISLL